MRGYVALARDVAIVSTALLVISLAGGERAIAAAAVVANVVWIAAMRRLGSTWRFRVETAAFLANGAIVVLRAGGGDVWLAAAAIFLLVVASDLSRLHDRYPVGSDEAVQQRIVLRHAVNLLLLAGASAAVIGLVVVIPIRPTLLALLLLAGLLVAGVTRLTTESEGE